MKNLFLITDHPELGTGNAKVARELIKRLQLNYKIVGMIGWSGIGDNNYDFPIYPISPDNQTSIVCQHIIEKAFLKNKIDAIVCHGDIWDFPYLTNINHIKKIGYITIDVHPLRREWTSIFRAFDGLAITSEWGAKQLANDLNIEAEFIHEGVDTSIFHPMDPQEKAMELKAVQKGCMAKGYNVPSFFMTMLARPIIRKNLPAGIRAISRMGRIHNDVGYVVLHSDDIGRDMNNMDLYINQYFPPKMPKIRKSKVGPRHKTSDEIIGKILSTCHVLVHPSMHEGFGLPLVEAMACGCVPICTNSSSMTELVQGRGELVKVAGYVVDATPGYEGVESEIIDDDDLFNKINGLYLDRNRLDKLRKTGIAFAKTLTWDKTVTKLDKLISDTLNNKIKIEVIKI